MSVSLHIRPKRYTNHRSTIIQINSVLSQYGLSVSGFSDGPRMTQFVVRLHPRVNLTKLKKIDEYLEIATSDPSIRTYIKGDKLFIEAHTADNTVDLAEMWTPEYIRQRDGVKLMLGKSIDGQPLYTDLAKCKHILIAGITGSGKSMLLHELILSMIVHDPVLTKLVLVDMKGTEFMKYAAIPYCSTIDSVDGAVAMARKLVNVMNARYQKLAKAGCRDIESYKAKGYPMDRIVFVIDEYADLILTAKKAIQEPIIRLAQKARACGIHLIIATQKPVSNVIDTLIKANMPTKICMRVNSFRDSRVVMDLSGGEKLLGNGDMLFLKDGSFEPIRIQGCYISEEEIDFVIDNAVAQCYAYSQKTFMEIEPEPEQKPKGIFGLFKGLRSNHG